MTLFLFCFLLGTIQVNALDSLYWPRELEYNETIITLYQPELETFEGNTLTGRQALAVKALDRELVFGAIRFQARMATDTEERIAILKSIKITDTHFPVEDSGKVDVLKDYLETTFKGADIEMSLDRLLSSLEIIADNESLSAQLNNEAPDIYFSSSPAILIYIDSEPILKDSDKSGVKYVVNSPYFIVQDIKKGLYYIKGGKWWYSSNNITTGWTSTTKVPGKIEKLATEAMDPEAEQDSSMQDLISAPHLIVVTEPAELVQSDGDPNFAPIAGTNLLYVTNTEYDILTEINTQNYYLLLNGRWFYSSSLQNNDWQFREPGELPADFAKIPVDSDISNVRASIPGTNEAAAAVLEQTIPQTATVDRKTATVSVTYDGNPEFKQIENTQVAYAVNSDKDVLLINNEYYCVNEGIWFKSSKATGPWEVSVSRPAEVDQIPPEEPTYNTKYVYVYDYTPDVVYVGYLPGYTCSYVYRGVVVYGTGWYYRPWYGTYYYPRPCTYGFGVHYNPWTGWGFSFGVSWGWFSVGFGTSWWGPAGYRYGYRHGYGRGYYHGYHNGYRAGYAAGRRQSYANNMYRNRNSGIRSTGISNRVGTRNAIASRPNAGARPGTRPNVGNRPANRPSTGQAGARPQTRPSTRPNNVFSDRSGNVYQRNNVGQIQQHNKGNWTRPSSPNQNNQLHRSHQARQYGTQRYNNFNSSRARAGAGRAGAARGSGRRR